MIPSPPSHKFEPRDGYEKSFLTKETRIERNISKRKSLVALLLVEPNIRE